MTEDKDISSPRAMVLARRSKGIYILPNMITLAALFGGFTPL
jgi:hypothetical protein